MGAYIVLSKRPTAAQLAKLKRAGFESIPTVSGQPCVEDQYYLGGYTVIGQEEDRRAEVRAIMGGEK